MRGHGNPIFLNRIRVTFYYGPKSDSLFVVTWRERDRSDEWRVGFKVKILGLMLSVKSRVRFRATAKTVFFLLLLLLLLIRAVRACFRQCSNKLYYKYDLLLLLFF